MINNNFQTVYTKLYEILMYMPIEKTKKIPQVIIKEIK